LPKEAIKDVPANVVENQLDGIILKKRRKE
jgi:hypothetical protein